MDKNKECSVIKDLMPLYKDCALSELSVQAVEEHIEKCDSCKEYKNCVFKDSFKLELADDVPELEKVETQNYKNIAKRLKKRKIRNTLIGIFSTLLVIILLNSMFTFQRVPSDCMKPTFKAGDICFINKMSYKFSKPSDGDIVCFLREDKVTHCKDKSFTRIVGIPGDKLLIKDGILYVNGEAKYENIYKNIDKAGTAKTEFIVPDGKYYFIGDNVNISYDSRFEIVGCAKEEDIIGKVYFSW